MERQTDGWMFAELNRTLQHGSRTPVLSVGL